MKYLILPQNSEDYADQISTQIWKIRKPAVSESDTTQKYCGHIMHSDGRVALVFPDESLKIHPDCDLSSLSTLIQAAYSDQVIKDLVAEHFDNLLPLPEDSLSDIETLLPKPFAANLKDKDFIVNDGWFLGGEI